MLELRELKTGLRVRGLVADDVTVVAVEPHGDTVIELGQITNGVAQAPFDVKVERASTVRRAVVERSNLVNASAHERAPDRPGQHVPSGRQPRLRRSASGNACLPLGTRMTTSSSATTEAGRRISVVLSNDQCLSRWDRSQ
jgi:hypothetical protein